MQSPEPVVEMSDVSKTFGHSTILDRISLTVPQGRIFGLIGPSGCGKSTTVRVLVGVLSPTSGEARVFGVVPERFSTRDRERIGYTPQGFVLYPTLTVAENARFVASLYGLGLFKRRRRIREVLAFLEIWDARNRLTRDVSGGMQRRLALACALLHNPPLLLVDEPTAGLDPVLRDKIWGLLRELRDRGTTILVTTQYIDEAGYCDTVAIMNKGHIAAIGTPEELRASALGSETVDVIGERLSKNALLAVLSLAGVSDAYQSGANSLRVKVTDIPSATPAIVDALTNAGVTVTAVQPHTPTFDEVFMAIVGRDAA